MVPMVRLAVGIAQQRVDGNNHDAAGAERRRTGDGRAHPVLGLHPGPQARAVAVGRLGGVLRGGRLNRFCSALTASCWSCTLELTSSSLSLTAASGSPQQRGENRVGRGIRAQPP